MQLDNPERDAEKGLGLGLAIVRKSANLLGHPLSLCSRVGQGSRFALKVPLTAPALSGNVVENKGTHEPPHVLLVGPPSPEADELAALLESWRFDVDRVADTGAAQTIIAGADTPQLIVLNFPGGAGGIEHGLAWLNRVAADTGHVLPALIVSNGPVPALGEQPGKAPRLLLTRPFRPARLRALIGRLLTHPDDLPD